MELRQLRYFVTLVTIVACARTMSQRLGWLGTADQTMR
ncbi:MAG: hypothetical protein JWN52_6214 [Actinomycetia bacterium]|nr:hypothetical protein [Actinomycetes bacterium]